MNLNGRPAWCAYAAVILGLHALGFTALVHTARSHAALLGMGFLAYTLGLRHAFDADHIAAIDNAVRKLVRQCQSPLGTGFYFSLGHSTVVFVLALATSLIARWAHQALPDLQAIGGVIGAAVSGGFLILIGILNLFIWIDIYLVFIRMRQGTHDAAALEDLLVSRGIVARVATPLFRI
ncbi:MAG TPA: HoxN/HupN/NixA family nickel/cobalt transporter, partial [bacterium]|nr:HoxN/HupN/NixA family nickel/cobalt transporter [bacterium]